jgi:hypothetical protein
VSTRALYGNEKLRPPFPALQAAHATADIVDLGDLDPGTWGATALRACSVCDRPLEGSAVHQVWISLRIATDVLPLLVNACSEACVQALPIAPDNYIRAPHAGGPGVDQPSAGYA